MTNLHGYYNTQFEDPLFHWMRIEGPLIVSVGPSFNNIWEDLLAMPLFSLLNLIFFTHIILL